MKWLSITAAALAAIGLAVLSTGAAPVEIIAGIIALGVVSIVAGVAHLRLNSATAVQTQTPTNEAKVNKLSSEINTKAKKLSMEDGQTMLLLAQSHELTQNGKKKDLNKAFECYLDAAKSGHYDALTPLERLAEDMSAQEQRQLSEVYGTFFQNKEKAAYWQSKAEEIENFWFQPTSSLHTRKGNK